MIRALLLLVTLFATPVSAQEVVAGLSQSRISITTNFDGSEILVFGAVKRSEALASDEPLQVAIAVAGPSEPVVVRRKDKRAGIWVNNASVEVDAAPSFYAVATSAPWDEVLKDTEDLRYKLSINRAIRSVGAEIEGSEAFTEALIRIRESENLYQTNIGAVEFAEQTLFDTSIRLPANLTEGAYSARFLLTQGGNVLDEYVTEISVQKVGLERFLYRLAHDRPLVYGLLSLAIAIFSGWAASAVFRYFRA